MAASVAAKGLPVASLAMWEPFSAGGFDGHDFLVFRFPPPTASATRRCPGSCAPPAAASSTAATRSGTATGGASAAPTVRSTSRFLPINGFAQTDLVPSTTVPYAMTPEVALQAARLLGAHIVVPIHFGRAPSATYVETDAPEWRFVDEARRLGQAVRVTRAGDVLRLAAIASS